MPSSRLKIRTDSRQLQSVAPRNSPALTDDVVWLQGVGPHVAAKLRLLGIERVIDLLLHLPMRYEDRRTVTPISSVSSEAEILVRGQIRASNIQQGRRHRTLKIEMEDGSGATLVLRFFHFRPTQRESLAAGRWIQAYGQVRITAQGFEMIHPEYCLSDCCESFDDSVGWVSVYPLVAGLTQLRFRLLIERAFDILIADPEFDRPLPGFHGPSTLAALRLIHQPPVDIDISDLVSPSFPARRRLIEEELLAHQLVMRSIRAKRKNKKAPVITGVRQASARLERSLSYAFTNAQRRTIGELADDLAGGRPMLRLLQGDVGCGKTAVAATVMLACAEAGLQVAMMVPTELLAEQHARTLGAMMAPLNQQVGLLSGKLVPAERKAALAAAASGTTRIWVGTHALIQDDVSFACLALVVIDEQHRFGVGQRLALHEKARRDRATHQLVMSATPIPRSLAQTIYADLDVSVIDEMPPGRRPVTTVAMSQLRRHDVLKRIGQVCQNGRQAYWVCTLVDESDQLEAQAAEETYVQLCSALSGLQIGMVHGRMKSTEKEAQLQAFFEGRTQVLVATTVIEVGVDVPNASIMVIDNAERLGLAQLHQLRGRVGRGGQASQCLLLYRPPLSVTARSRLGVIRRTHDGFKIAEHDLILRGPGELLGRRQTGVARMRVADPLRDAALIPALQKRADNWIHKEPSLTRRMVSRWIGSGESYGYV